MSTRALFEAAREDAPTPDARDAMWSRISAASTATTAAAGAATLATKSAAPAGLFGTKLVVLGGIIGAGGAVLGVILTLIVVSPDRSGLPATTAAAAPRRTAAVVAPGMRLAQPTPRTLDTASVETVTELAAPAPTTAVTSTPDDPASDLSAEAKLVSDARAALVRGDAQTALALVKQTHRLGTRALEPEELGIESRALRSLGRVDEAAAIDLLLKRRFPDSALAR